MLLSAKRASKSKWPFELYSEKYGCCPQPTNVSPLYSCCTLPAQIASSGGELSISLARVAVMVLKFRFSHSARDCLCDVV